MSMAKRSKAEGTDTQSPSLHVANSHDLIRVHGARENNLKDVSVEIPKRRLTVFTGVSGSGKSSLVFDTIAYEYVHASALTGQSHSLGLFPRTHTEGGRGVDVQVWIA
jgi:putative ribosome biogenesis GTPase RsgA